MSSMNMPRAVLESNNRHYLMDFCVDLRQWLKYMLTATQIQLDSVYSDPARIESDTTLCEHWLETR